MTETARTMDGSEPTVIDSTQEARDQYGYLYGHQEVELSITDVQALIWGKTVAFHDGGEKVTFLSVKGFEAND